MSFIDLYSNNVFTEAEILRRTESMIRTYYSYDEEIILNRKLSGMIIGSYVLSPEEQVELANFSQVVENAKIENDQATSDNELLKQILITEKAYLRLQQPLLEEGTEEELTIDAAERNESELIISQASPEVMEWVLKRNPEDITN